MKRSKSQIGSAHVVIVGILVIALMATLGVIFYQNFIAKKADTAQVRPAVTTNPNKTAQVAFNSSIYELDYPADWSVASTNADSSNDGGSTTTINNANHTVQVTLSISTNGVNGACDVNDGLKVSYYNVGATPVTKLTDESLYLVESMSDNIGGGYTYKIGLTPDGGDTHTAVGESHCNVAHVGIASTILYQAGSQSIVHPTILATIDFPKLTTAKDPTIKDMQQVKDLLATSDYKAAVKVLESARKK